MAERRMFHSAVVESDVFLDLPAGAQALYFHLCMHADDDGFINGPRQVARKLRRPPRELQLLCDSGFLINFEGIVVVKHWLVGNTLKIDRLRPPRYPEIAEKLYIKDNRAYTLEPEPGFENLLRSRLEKLESKRNPKVRKGKVRKDNLREDKIKEDNLREYNSSVDEDPDEPDLAAADTDTSLKFMKGKLGKGVVLLSQMQQADLLEKMDIDSFDYYVARLADFILTKQARVKNHYATILKWWEEDRRLVE